MPRLDRPQPSRHLFFPLRRLAALALACTACSGQSDLATGAAALGGSTGANNGWLDGADMQPDGSMLLRGWACTVGYAASVEVHVYSGGVAWGGGTFITAWPANLPNEPGVTAACGNTSYHRFSFSIDAATVAANAGKGIFVHGINVAGRPNDTIGNSGIFRFHNGLICAGTQVNWAGSQNHWGCDAVDNVPGIINSVGMVLGLPPVLDYYSLSSSPKGRCCDIHDQRYEDIQRTYGFSCDGNPGSPDWTLAIQCLLGMATCDASTVPCANANYEAANCIVHTNPGASACVAAGTCGYTRNNGSGCVADSQCPGGSCDCTTGTCIYGGGGPQPPPNIPPPGGTCTACTFQSCGMDLYCGTGSYCGSCPTGWTCNPYGDCERVESGFCAAWGESCASMPCCTGSGTCDHSIQICL